MFFGVVAKVQTWRNIGYLLLAFPLGILYFVFLITGFSLGFGLFITLLGIPILVGVIAASYGLGEFERVMSNQLLQIQIPVTRRLSQAGGLWEKLKALVVSSETWKRIFYLFLKFPFGIVGFVFVVVAFTLFAQVIAPLAYQQDWYDISIGTVWQLDELWEALVVAAVGVVLGFGFLHLVNGTAHIWGLVATALLGPTHATSDEGQQAPGA